MQAETPGGAARAAEDQSRPRHGGQHEDRSPLHHWTTTTAVLATRGSWSRAMVRRCRWAQRRRRKYYLRKPPKYAICPPSGPSASSLWWSLAGMFSGLPSPPVCPGFGVRFRVYKNPRRLAERMCAWYVWLGCAGMHACMHACVCVCQPRVTSNNRTGESNMRPRYKRLRYRYRHVFHRFLSAKGLSVCAGCICLFLSLSLYTCRACVFHHPLLLRVLRCSGGTHQRHKNHDRQLRHWRS